MIDNVSSITMETHFSKKYPRGDRLVQSGNSGDYLPRCIIGIGVHLLCSQIDRGVIAMSYRWGINGKKGMEMWQLALLILALILLVFVIAWYGGLNKEISGLLGKLKGLL